MPTLPNAALWRDAENPSAGRWYHRGPEILADQGPPTIERNAPRGTAQVTLVAVIEPGVHALADARLIAAAKDLRVALTLARMVLEQRGSITTCVAANGPTVGEVIARAVAKSEGR
jgi:hypothetical protein